MIFSFSFGLVKPEVFFYISSTTIVLYSRDHIEAFLAKNIIVYIS